VGFAPSCLFRATRVAGSVSCLSNGTASSLLIAEPDQSYLFREPRMHLRFIKLPQKWKPRKPQRRLLTTAALAALVSAQSVHLWQQQQPYQEEPGHWRQFSPIDQIQRPPPTAPRVSSFHAPAYNYYQNNWMSGG
jgi:hypothetical protein